MADKNSKDIAGRIGGTAAWAGLGNVAGFLIGLLVPDAIVADAVLGGSFGTLFGSLYALGVFGSLRDRPLRSLDGCLQSADRMFLLGRLTEAEHIALRKKCIEKHG